MLSSASVSSTLLMELIKGWSEDMKAGSCAPLKGESVPSVAQVVVWLDIFGDRGMLYAQRQLSLLPGLDPNENAASSVKASLCWKERRSRALRTASSWQPAA